MAQRVSPESHAAHRARAIVHPAAVRQPALRIELGTDGAVVGRELAPQIDQHVLALRRRHRAPVHLGQRTVGPMRRAVCRN
eukprot:5408769-Prymnesium_polylepis.1